MSASSDTRASLQWASRMATATPLPSSAFMPVMLAESPPHVQSPPTSLLAGVKRNPALRLKTIQFHAQVVIQTTLDAIIIGGQDCDLYVIPKQWDRCRCPSHPVPLHLIEANAWHRFPTRPSKFHRSISVNTKLRTVTGEGLQGQPIAIVASATGDTTGMLNNRPTLCCRNSIFEVVMLLDRFMDLFGVRVLVKNIRAAISAQGTMHDAARFHTILPEIPPMCSSSLVETYTCLQP